MYVYMLWMWRPHGSLFFEMRLLTESRVSPPNQYKDLLEWLTDWSSYSNQDPSASAFLDVGLLAHATAPGFDDGAGDPNSDPHACVASTLQTEPSLPSPKHMNTFQLKVSIHRIA